jgi:hypothetical protein
MARHANYSVLDVDGQFVWLKDEGPWSQYLTITNDAEGVVEQVVQRYPNHRIKYYDSEGELTELLVKDGKFAGYA